MQIAPPPTLTWSFDEYSTTHNGFNLFVQRFGTVPSHFGYYDIPYPVAIKRLEGLTAGAVQVVQSAVMSPTLPESLAAPHYNYQYVFFEHHLVVVEYDSYGTPSPTAHVSIFFPAGRPELLPPFQALMDGVFAEAPERQILFVSRKKNGLSTKSEPLRTTPCPVEINYGPAFFPKYENLVALLADPEQHGLYLLHGAPGTGKTSLIRHLLHLLPPTTRTIFVPSQYVEIIASPEFTDFMLTNKNAVLIIEDAEAILQSKGGSRSTALTNLLNLTDGILGDVLNLKVICTFNLDIGKIDDALLRKGRLRFRHEFEPLSADDAAAAAAHYNITLTTPGVPLTLAELFHQGGEDAVEIPTKGGIGFAK